MFMIEDKEGWYWIGTNNGLYRYKGEKIEEYDFSDGVSSPIFLTCIPRIDKDGTIGLVILMACYLLILVRLQKEENILILLV